jgi:acetylornithine deacetylase/succinyl-diaminopimelate desuccinylase-like protein
MNVDVVRLKGRTPLIFIDVPATGTGSGDDCVLLYGHLDKQPEMTGWSAHLGPWKPVIEGDRLYGRGAADDGYALFGSLAAILALQDQGAPRARCVIMIEACEESGSYDLPYYVDHLAERIGKPSLVVCLDSGCGNYDQLWLTTSLRGMTGGNLSVQVLEEGVHSGDASGIVASSFRILRQVISRLEDEGSGRIKPQELYVDIPAQRVEQARRTAQVLGDAIYSKFPFVAGMQPVEKDLTELVLNRTWRPALAITGLDGMPPLDSAGNVLRPSTAVKLSLRLPPTLEGNAAGERVKRLLEANPPYGAKVSFALERRPPAGTRRRWRRGSKPRSTARRAASSARRRRTTEKAAAFVHGHARREVPRRAVPHHRCARSALERAWAQRVPAHPDRQARQHVRGQGACRSLQGQRAGIDDRRRGKRCTYAQGRRRLLLIGAR